MVKPKFRPNVTAARAKPALSSVPAARKLSPTKDPTTNEVIVENEPSNHTNTSCDKVSKVVPTSSGLLVSSELESSDDDNMEPLRSTQFDPELKASHNIRSSTSHPSEVEHAIIHHKAESSENEQEEEFIISYYNNPDSPERIISHESSEVLDSSENSSEGNLPVPQLMIDPDGNVVIDEQSLYIPQTAHEYPKEEQKRRKTPRWTEADTTVFYRALTCIGLDFSAMEQRLKKWNRRELKAKYKRELKQNPQRMNQAVRDNCNVQIQYVESQKELKEKKKEGKKTRDGVFIICYFYHYSYFSCL